MSVKKPYDMVSGPSQSFGDSRWHVGLFREGDCLSWSSFDTRREAERWMENPRVAPRAALSFSRS